MKGNVKVTIAVLAVLLLGAAYLIGSYVATAQMGNQPAQGSSVSDSVAERIAQALEQMSQTMNQMTGHMAMGNSSMMGMNGSAASNGPQGQGMSAPMGGQGCAAASAQMGPMSMDHSTMMGMMNSMEAMHGQMQHAMPAEQQAMTPMGQPNAPAPAGQLSESDLVRASDEADITIEATWMNPLLEPENALVFRVSMDTHSEDLLQYDLPALAVLRDGKDQALAATFAWEPESESSHHRSGILRAQAAGEGQSLLAAVAEGVVLELKDVGTPLRRFEWQVKLAE